MVEKHTDVKNTSSFHLYIEKVLPSKGLRDNLGKVFEAFVRIQRIY